MSIVREVEGLLQTRFGGKKWETLLVDSGDDHRLQQAARLIRRGSTKFRQAVGFRSARDLSGTRRGWLRKNIERYTNPEHKLERMLVAAKDELFNQFNFLSGLASGSRCKTMSVDIVRADLDSREILELFELKSLSPGKPDYTSNSPVHALVELMSYYYLYLQALRVDRKLPSMRRRVLLTVACPRDYFDMWAEQGYKFVTLESFAARMSSATNAISRKRGEPKVTIRFLVVEISHEHVEAATKALHKIRSEFDLASGTAR